MADVTSCPYTALGLTKEATAIEIKKAFRKLALEFHPDKVQGAEAKEAASKKFQKVNEAYGVLSDEEKRREYDDRIKLMELRKRAKSEANISVPRTPTASHYDVRYAEPRPDTYRTKSTSSRAAPTSSSKVYSQYPPSRSYEEDIYTTRHYEDATRSARRTQSYDEKPSKRDDERRERDSRRRMEDREEKEKLIRAFEKKEKERQRMEKEQKMKIKEKQRKREAEEKRSHRDNYVDRSYDDDEPSRSSKSDKKKSSSSKKHDVRDRERSAPREVVREEVAGTDKEAQFMMAAAQYINASRSKAPNPPPLSRSNTTQEYSHRYAQNPPLAVPTPPSTQDSPFPRPVTVEEESDDDRPRRSSAKPLFRRPSETPKVRDRSSHKKSSSGPKEYVEAVPVIVDPQSRRVPQFAKAGSTPPRVPDSPPRKLPRAQTMKEADFPRASPPQPSISRSSTYHYPSEYDSREPRGRDRSRFQSQVVDEEDESEDDRRYESSRRADRRHRTRSPDIVPMPAEYPPSRGGAAAYRYQVKEGRTVPVATVQRDDHYYYPEDASPPSRKSKGASYYSSPYVRTTEVRPSMPPRDSAYSSSGGYIPSKIKTAQAYTPKDVQYSWEPQPQSSWAS